jgi:hypothetical protein
MRLLHHRTPLSSNENSPKATAKLSFARAMPSYLRLCHKFLRIPVTFLQELGLILSKANIIEYWRKADESV